MTNEFTNELIFKNALMMALGVGDIKLDNNMVARLQDYYDSKADEWFFEFRGEDDSDGMGEFLFKFSCHVATRLRFYAIPKVLH